MSPLVWTEEQELLAQSARDVLGGAAPLAGLRARRAAGLVQDAPLWAQLVELGWPAIPVPEAQGGLGLGLPEVAVVMEALGAHLAATPMASTVVAARLDPDFGVGRVLALAWREHARDRDPARVASRVEDGRLWGTKRAVLDASVADAFVVSARVGSEIGLFRVAASDAQRTPLARVDGRDAADVRFDGAPAEPLLGGLEALGEALDHLAVALAAEHLGGMQAVLDRTLAWLRERVQFGVPIGSFQALQHRAVDLFMQVELCRGAVLQASREPTHAWAELARIKCGEVYLQVAKEAVQLHGGIGMADECDVGLFLKRAMVAAFG